MEKTPQNEKTETLTRLLRRISQGKDPLRLRKEADRLIGNVTPQDIAAAEQNLINIGYSARLAGQLSTAFMLMGAYQNNMTIQINLPSNHILRKVIAEHDLIRCFVADLEDIVSEIEKNENITSVCWEFMHLCHIIEHLDAMEEHIDREEDIIFPYLRKHGWTSLCKTAHSDHVYIRIAIDNLIRLIGSFNNMKVKEFKVRLCSITKYLCPTLNEHLLREDKILYPIALELIQDKKVWDKIKAVCDNIGYCGVHF